jgi:hypothetical protein
VKSVQKAKWKMRTKMQNGKGEQKVKMENE